MTSDNPSFAFLRAAVVPRNVAHGADPNRMTRWHHTGLHQAIRRDNARVNIELMLDHGADPGLPNQWDGKSAVQIAARRGRDDLLELFEARGIPIRLYGVERLLAAAARGDTAALQEITQREPELLRELVAVGGQALAEFAAVGNTHGLTRLLDLGVEIDAVYRDGDGYFNIAPNSTALHVAAWCANHETLRLLIERGAEVNRRDGRGRSPLMLAVRACVDSYWTDDRSPESVDALLRAGAMLEGVAFPSGYADVDALLEARGARRGIRPTDDEPQAGT